MASGRPVVINGDLGSGKSTVSRLPARALGVRRSAARNGEVLERGVRTADGLHTGLVYAGISLGVMPAQKLAQTRPGARGALLFESFVPPAEALVGRRVLGFLAA